jgi:hypothetical protein
VFLGLNCDDCNWDYTSCVADALLEYTSVVQELAHIKRINQEGDKESAYCVLYNERCWFVLKICGVIILWCIFKNVCVLIFYWFWCLFKFFFYVFVFHLLLFFFFKFSFFVKLFVLNFYKSASILMFTNNSRECYIWWFNSMLEQGDVG